jgi:ABC-type phosphate/phosphonate transport system substrate-binding protein
MNYGPCREVLFGLSLVIAAQTANADLILSAPPRESAEEAKATYDPFAAFLGEVIGERVVYEHPRTWSQYVKLMKEGHYDVVFDGPHFAAWRIKNINHVPIAVLPGSLSFVVLAKASDQRVNGLGDLSGIQFCGLPKPNLGTIAYLSEFSTGLIQPEILPIKGGFDEVVDAVKDDRCRVGVVRDSAWGKLSTEGKTLFKVVHKSRSFPNQTITVSEKVKQPVREKLTAALTAKKEIKAAERLFNENSKKERYFVPARADEFRDAATLLEQDARGW